MSRPIPKRTWHLKFTQEELAEFAGKTKVCPHCFQEKGIVDHFGLRRGADGKIFAQCPCFPCKSRKAHSYTKERMQRDPEFRERLISNVRKWRRENGMRANIAERQRVKRNWKRDRLKHGARLMSHALYPVQKNCSVETCKELGQRHHLDYNLPAEIIWLCPRHHGMLHRSYSLTDQDNSTASDALEQDTSNIIGAVQV